MSIISRFLREQERYTTDWLAELFELDGNKKDEFFRDMLAAGVLKRVLPKENGDTGSLVAFKFVGVIIYGDCVLKVFPKYIHKEKTPSRELKQALAAIEKCSKGIGRWVMDTSDGAEGEGILSTIASLVEDYREYGLYTADEHIIEENGNGDILWQKTIDETYPIITEGRPYYFTLYTRKTADDEHDYFVRLHAAVLKDCSKRMEEAGLFDLFGLDSIPVEGDSLESFGEVDYIMSRILRELSVQFGTRNQRVLRLMHAYLAKEPTLRQEVPCMSIYGTSSFHVVWEKACAEVFGDKLHEPLKNLPVPERVRSEYGEDTRLIELIQKPAWCVWQDGWHHKRATETLTPDFVSFDGDTMVILDAKYYDPVFGSRLARQPGIESVTKQYLYQQAYRRFAEGCGFRRFVNCFVFPTEEPSSSRKGFVHLGFMKKLGLEDIRIRMLPAGKVLKCYANGKMMGMEWL